MHHECHLRRAEEGPDVCVELRLRHIEVIRAARPSKEGISG